MTYRVLGVHTGIDASACLLEDGVLRYALQEERFTGVKQYIGMPKQSIAKILEMAKLTIDKIDDMAVATTYDLVSPGEGVKPSPMQVARKFIRWKIPPLFILWEDLIPEIKKRNPALFMIPVRVQLERRLDWLRTETGFQGPITVVDHHAAHAASGYYSSPWKDEPVLVLSNDAAGDGLCATVSIGENGTMRRIAQTKHTHSLGYLYTSVTHWMGMKAHQDEFKILGLSEHASPKHGQASYDEFKKLIDVEGLQFKRKVFEPLCMPYVRKHMHTIFDYNRFDNIAWGLQKHTEDLMLKWTKNAIEKTGIHKVAAGGGVFMNIVVNKLIRELPGVEGFYPMPTAGDTTTSIGAAYVVYAARMREQGSETRIAPLGPLYLGDDFTDKDVETAMDEAMAMAGQFGRKMTGYYGDEFDKSLDAVHMSQVDDLAADLILKGKIVARCRGPMEFGARALGNRSILCDASELRNVRKLNRVIKSRDHFMPYSPVVKEARMADYFVRPEFAPYMTRTFDTTPLAERDLIAGLHQANLSARPQTLRPSWNPGYARILDIFENETGRGGLVNTSANIHGEPIIHGAKEAISMFVRSGLKYLVLGNYLVSKHE